MWRPSEDDRDAVDRAFADLVARYHLTSDRPDPLEAADSGDASAALDPLPGSAPTTTRRPAPDANGTTEDSTNSSPPAAAEPSSAPYPAFRFVPADEIRPPTAAERFVPQPPLPLPRPTWPVLVAWIAMGYALLAVLAAAMGAELPRWAGWIALAGFLGGFGLLISRLPRNRPPDAGDGAVL